MDEPLQPTARYTIDAADRIVDIDDGWLRFARDNGAPHLTRETVVGRALWDFVTGEETRLLYQALLGTVRRRDTEVVVPFRCDSPALRRHMRLVLSHRSDGFVRLDAVLVSIEPTPFLAILHPGLPRSGTTIPMCGWCKRLRVGGTEWAEIEDVIVRLELFTPMRPPGLSHTVCPECRAAVEAIAEPPDAA